jgi:hypothetical protein
VSPLDIAERIIGSAEKHGKESEPDHEVGDLQDALRAAIELMTEGQLKEMSKWADEYGLWSEQT